MTVIDAVVIVLLSAILIALGVIAVTLIKLRKFHMEHMDHQCSFLVAIREYSEHVATNQNQLLSGLTKMYSRIDQSANLAERSDGRMDRLERALYESE